MHLKPETQNFRGRISPRWRADSRTRSSPQGPVVLMDGVVISEGVFRVPPFYCRIRMPDPSFPCSRAMEMKKKKKTKKGNKKNNNFFMTFGNWMSELPLEVLEVCKLLLTLGGRISPRWRADSRTRSPFNIFVECQGGGGT